MTGTYFPGAGDIVWTHFDPSLGREQSGRRPALVLSAKSLSENAGFAVVAPITSRVRPFPTSVVLAANSPVAGEILLNQIRSIDLLARPVRFAGNIAPEQEREVREKLDLLITI